ncbi:MAG: DUF4339 domain-containing protein [Planctomycetaceae bacterium]|nr:DUF4339 domain-containing protein [Planctomycetaceae bacterium]
MALGVLKQLEHKVAPVYKYMGIRFFCPNGHKLHVKSQLAGLRAHCPDCGAVLVIPLKSTRKSSKEGGGLIENAEPQPQISNTTPNSKNFVGNTITPQDFLNPSIDWYICNPDDGTQQGPLKNTLIRQLAQQQKLKTNFYIWREGLSDWVPVSSILSLF